MMIWISTWFGPELWVALAELAAAAGIDLVLTLALVLAGKGGGPFEWRRLPQVLVSLAPYVLGVVLGALVVRYNPELRSEYLLSATGLAAWLARDWRGKFSVLTGFKPPETLRKAG